MTASGDTALAATALAATAQRLRALRPEYPDSYGVRAGVPDEPGWLPVDGLAADGTVARWCAEARERDNPRRLTSVAATAVASAFTHAVLGRVTAALVLDRRGWDVGGANLVLHRDGDVDRVAVRSTSCLVLPDDPAAGEPGAVVVPDLVALLDRVAGGAVAVLEPVFEAIRGATRYGIVPLWNGAADAVLGTAAYAPLYAGAGQGTARELGLALVDALVARGARIRVRGSLAPMRWRTRTYGVPVRAACCLYYKTEPEVGCAGDEYCLACPFLGADDRSRRFADFLDGVVGGPPGVTAGDR